MCLGSVLIMPGAPGHLPTNQGPSLFRSSLRGGRRFSDLNVPKRVIKTGRRPRPEAMGVSSTPTADKARRRDLWAGSIPESWQQPLTAVRRREEKVEGKETAGCVPLGFDQIGRASYRERV